MLLVPVVTPLFSLGLGISFGGVLGLGAGAGFCGTMWHAPHGSQQGPSLCFFDPHRDFSLSKRPALPQPVSHAGLHASQLGAGHGAGGGGGVGAHGGGHDGVQPQS